VFHAHAGKHADRGPSNFAGIATRIFQRLPRAFEKDAMLRVKQFGFARVSSRKKSASNKSAPSRTARALT